MPSRKTVRARRRSGHHFHGGRVKNALDWGRKEQRAKNRREVAAFDADESYDAQAVERLEKILAVRTVSNPIAWIETPKQDRFRPERPKAIVPDRTKGEHRPFWLIRRGPNQDKRWTEADDEWIRWAWDPKAPSVPAMARPLETILGRSWQSIVSRFFMLGFRRFTQQEHAVFKQRTLDRRTAIDECLVKGEPRQPLCNRLGISECTLQARKGDLEYQGYVFPKVAWWQWPRETDLEATAKIHTHAYLEYREAMRDVGLYCKCHHREGLHIDGICTHIERDGYGCECIEFMPFNERRKPGTGRTDVMGYNGGRVCILVPPISIKELSESWSLDTLRKIERFDRANTAPSAEDEYLAQEQD
jgi:hypothetical protein